MDYILLNENTMQLYHTNGNILSTLDKKFSFSSNIYLTINNMVITINLIMISLPSIVHILNWYFEFINPSWLLNSKQQPRQKLLKRYRNQFYRRKIKKQEVLPKKQSTAWEYRWSNSYNDDTTSRNQLILLIKFTLLSCSKEKL